MICRYTVSVVQISSRRVVVMAMVVLVLVVVSRILRAWPSFSG